MAREFTIQGNTFPSIAAAARHYRISYSKFYWHLVLGRTRKEVPDARKLETTIRGVTYPSQKDAAEAIGVSETTIYLARKRGTLDDVGLRKFGGSK